MKQPDCNFLTLDEVLSLQVAHRKERDRKLADRIKCILFLNKGLTYAEVSDLLMIDDNTARKFYEIYTTKGLEELMRVHYVAALSYLTLKQMARLSNYLDSHMMSSTKEVKAYILDTFGIEYTCEGVRKLLINLGFVYKKTKQIPGKSDAEQQKAFAASYEELKRNKGAEDSIYFMDGVHPLHNSMTGKGWIKKGKEKGVASNTGRDRLNINGACNAATGEVIIQPSEVINAQSTVALFKKIESRKKRGLIYIIADNAKYYRSKVVSEYVKANKRIRLVFLPPYSPNLNVIERLWKMYKKEILYNKYYPKFELFKKATMNFFDQLIYRKQEVMNLLLDNFYYPSVRFSKI